MIQVENIIKRILSIKLFLASFLLTVLSFNFLDISIFKATRSMSSLIFSFFKDFIDPLSDIIDPFNIAVCCLIILILILNIKNSLKEPKKLKILSQKIGYKYEIILESLNYYIEMMKHIIISIICAGIVCHILKYVLGVSRPKYFFLEGYQRLDYFNIEHKVNSLPSGHAQAAFTLAILFLIYVNKYTFYVLTLASLMAISRIFMSMHFPSDLILGAYIGVFVPTLIFKIYFFEKIRSFNKDNIFTFSSLFKLIYLKRLV